MASEELLRELIGDRLDELNPTTREILERVPDETVRKTYAKLLELGLTKEKIASQAQLLGRNPETIQRNAEFLMQLGLTKQKIATLAQLLSYNPETIQRNAEFLMQLGLTKEKIATNAHLLGMNPETIQRNAEFLMQLGLTKEKIASQAHLLGMNPETIQRNAEFLMQLGLTKEKMASQAHLLGRDPETLQRNYEFLRRFYSRKDILENPQYLGYSRKTAFAHVSYLYEFGVNHEQFLVITTPKCKRKKVAVLLREKYGYDENLNNNEKKELIENAKRFVRSKPHILSMSEKKIKEKYREAA